MGITRFTNFVLVLVFVLGSFVPVAIWATGVPGKVSYQGHLNHRNGMEVDGIYSLTFTIYDGIGKKLWDEVYNGRKGYGPKIEFKRGYFKVSLGAYNALSPAVFNANETHLGIKIGNDSEMTPRIKLLTVPYSFQSENTNAFDNLDSSQFLRSDITTSHNANLHVKGTLFASEYVGFLTVPKNAVQAKNIIDGSIITDDLRNWLITNQKITDNAITSSKIRNGEVMTDDLQAHAVTFKKLHDNSVDTHKIIDGTVLGQDLADRSISSGKIAIDAIDSTQIINGQIKRVDIENGAIGRSKIDRDAVGSSQIVDGEIYTSDLANLAVTAEKMAAGSVRNNNLIKGTYAHIEGIGGRIYVSPSYNVGIGVEKPTHTVHVRSVSAPVSLKLEADPEDVEEAFQPSLIMSQDGGKVQGKLGFFSQENVFRIQNDFADGLALGTNGREQVRISSQGNVGIGIENPAAKLVVDGDAHVRGIVRASQIEGNLRPQNIVGVLALDQLPSLPASKVTSGKLGVERIPGLPASIITSGRIPPERFPVQVNRLNIASNLGIGTLNPKARMHVYSQSGPAKVLIETDRTNKAEADQPSLVFSQDGGAVTGQLGFFDASNILTLENSFQDALVLGSSGKERLRIDKNGMVGIGTTTPRAALEVKGNVLISGSIDATSLRAKLDPRDIVGALASEQIPYLMASKISSGVLSSNRIPLLAASKIDAGVFHPDRIPKIVREIHVKKAMGIGTQQPKAMLHVVQASGSTTALIASDPKNEIETDQPRLVLSQDGGEVTGELGFYNGSNTLTLKNNHKDSLVFGTHNQERIRITETGKVGIGLSNPVGALDVAGDLVVYGHIKTKKLFGKLQGSFITGQLRNEVIPELSAKKISTGVFDVARIPKLTASQIPKTLDDTVVQHLRVKKDARIGGRAVLYGAVQNPGIPTQNWKGFEPLMISQDGRFQIGSTGPISTATVTDIKPLSDAFRHVLRLQVKSFVFKDSGEPGYGLLVEDVQRHGLKGLISYDANGKAIGVFERGINLYLLEAMKGLNNDIKRQEVIIKQQQVQINRLIKTLNNLSLGMKQDLGQ
ncbi:MAG: putative RNA-binding protein [Candidatus Marinamargulisbacteria bacterium]|jgi:predicted RNA-binding protein